MKFFFYTFPAIFCMKFNASFIYVVHTFLCSAIVSSAIVPLYKQSGITNVEPILFSKSNEIESNLHKWKNILYWIVDS